MLNATFSYNCTVCMKPNINTKFKKINPSINKYLFRVNLCNFKSSEIGPIELNFIAIH